VLPASQKYTSEANGRVTLRIESGADNTPISVPGLLASSAEKYGNLPALNYKSDNKWVTVTYKYDYCNNLFRIYLNNTFFNHFFFVVESMNKMFELLPKLF